MITRMNASFESLPLSFVQQDSSYFMKSSQTIAFYGSSRSPASNTLVLRTLSSFHQLSSFSRVHRLGSLRGSPFDAAIKSRRSLIGTDRPWWTVNGPLDLLHLPSTRWQRMMQDTLDQQKEVIPRTMATFNNPACKKLSGKGIWFECRSNVC
jgi:hypothetical protein